MARRHRFGVDILVRPRPNTSRRIGQPKLPRAIDDGELDAQDERLLLRVVGRGREKVRCLLVSGWRLWLGGSAAGSGILRGYRLRPFNRLRSSEQVLRRRRTNDLAGERGWRHGRTSDWLIRACCPFRPRRSRRLGNVVKNRGMGVVRVARRELYSGRRDRTRHARDHLVERFEHVSGPVVDGALLVK
jgi:hypothetical protein